APLSGAAQMVQGYGRAAGTYDRTTCPHLPTCRELVDRALAGDSEAQEALADRAMQIARECVGSWFPWHPELLDDAVNETALQVLIHLRAWRGNPPCLYWWIRVIARRVALRLIRFHLGQPVGPLTDDP